MRLPLMSGFGLVTGFMMAVTSPGTAWSQVDSAGGLTDRQLQFFEGKVRPLLVKHCYECHSTEAGKAEGNLLLDSRPCGGVPITLPLDSNCLPLESTEPRCFEIADTFYKKYE